MKMKTLHARRKRAKTHIFIGVPAGWGEGCFERPGRFSHSIEGTEKSGVTINSGARKEKGNWRRRGHHRSAKLLRGGGEHEKGGYRKGKPLPPQYKKDRS